MPRRTPEIAAKLTADKRKNAIEDIVDKVQNAVDGGSNFTEAAAAAKLPVTTTPLITANGTSRADPNFKLPPNLAPALKTGFEIAPNDPPEIVTLPNDAGYALVSPGAGRAGRPSPVREHSRLRSPPTGSTSRRCSALAPAATQIAAKASAGHVAGRCGEAGGRRASAGAADRRAAHPDRQCATARSRRRCSCCSRSRRARAEWSPDPQGRGFFVVKVDKIMPGNAMLQPSLIGQMQSELQQAVSEDYAHEFLAAMRADMKIKRNEARSRR